MNIGWSRVEITPPVDTTELGGQFYNRQATGTKSPLYATTCLFEDVAIVSLDLVAVPPTIDRRILKEEFGLREIIYCATHNHAGPKFNLSDKNYADLIEKIHESVRLSLQNVRPNQKISFGYESAVTGRVRRVQMLELGENSKDAIRAFSGSVDKTSIYYNTLSSPEKFAGLSGDTNCIINALYTFDEEDNLTGIIANVPCPAQCLEHSTELSADYWAEVRNGLNLKFNKNIYLLPLCGASGDCSPHMVVNRFSEQRRHKLLYNIDYPIQQSSRDLNRSEAEYNDIARTVVDSLYNIYEWARRDIQDYSEFEFRKFNIEADVNRLTEENERVYNEDIGGINRFKDRTTDPENLALCNRQLERLNSIHESRQRTPRQLTEEVYLLQIGPCVFVFSGHELYSDFGHEVDVNSPFMQTFIVQNTSAKGVGYLAPQRHMEELGYGSTWTNRINSDGGKILVKEIVDNLREMYQNDIERSKIILPEDTVLKDEYFRTFNDMVGKHIYMQANGSYKVQCECEAEHVETLYEPATDLISAPYLTEGWYALYGCEAELEDAQTTILQNVDAINSSYEPVWTKFQLTMPALLTRVCIPMKVGSYNNVYVPILKKLESAEENLPIVDCSGNTIEFIYEEN